jgi:hypothetical protein
MPYGWGFNKFSGTQSMVRQINARSWFWAVWVLRGWACANRGSLRRMQKGVVVGNDNGVDGDDDDVLARVLLPSDYKMLFSNIVKELAGSP